MSNNDQVLINAYLKLRVPADRIAAFLPKRQAFLDLLHFRSNSSIQDDDLIWRLLQLRKSGKLPPLKS